MDVLLWSIFAVVFIGSGLYITAKIFVKKEIDAETKKDEEDFEKFISF